METAIVPENRGTDKAYLATFAGQSGWGLRTPDRLYYFIGHDRSVRQLHDDDAPALVLTGALVSPGLTRILRRRVLAVVQCTHALQAA